MESKFSVQVKQQKQAILEYIILKLYCIYFYNIYIYMVGVGILCNLSTGIKLLVLEYLQNEI